MLPLRSRTSWRLRALTVTCLPRDWTWAGVYHFANNRRPDTTCPKDTTASGTVSDSDPLAWKSSYKRTPTPHIKIVQNQISHAAAILAE